MIEIRQVMRRHVITAPPTTSIQRIAKTLSTNKIGSVVIVDKSKPVGIVTNEDVVDLIAKGKNPKTIKAKSFLKRSFVTAHPSDDVIKVSKKMVKRRVKRVPVIERGRLVGILTDKEVLVTTPEMIDVLSEKLKARVEGVSLSPQESISGICEQCEGYGDTIRWIGGKWICGDCRD